MQLALLREMERMARRDFPTLLASWKQSADAESLDIKDFQLFRDRDIFDRVTGLITNFVAPFKRSEYSTTGLVIKTNHILDLLADQLCCDRQDILIIEGSKLRFSYDETLIEFCKFSGLYYDKFTKSWDVTEPEDFDEFLSAFSEHFSTILFLDGFGIYLRVEDVEATSREALAQV